MDWKEYQDEVHQNLLEAYPLADISYDIKLPGRYSKTSRQIDVLIENKSTHLKIIVDAKYFSRRVDVKCVESFISMVHDIGAEKGLLITQKGYSKAAINRAYYDPHSIELDVLSLDELLRFQALNALPYSGTHTILVSAPFGWVIDAKRREGVLAFLYQRGLSLEEAETRHELMYINFWHKDHAASSIDELINLQNEGIKEQDTNAVISIVDDVNRSDGRQVQIRNVTWTQKPFKEITGFIDCDDFIVFFVMISPILREMRNFTKLVQVLTDSMPSKIEFDNTAVIDQLESRVDLIVDPEEKANAYCQLAEWYSEMHDNDAELKNRRLCWQTFPNVYRNISPLILIELESFEIDIAINYSIRFFSLDPRNPRIMQDLVHIYSNKKHYELFKNLIAKLKLQHFHDAEALANLSTHLGIFLADNQENELAAREFETARFNFIQIKTDHYMIAEIDKTRIHHKV